MRPSAAASRFLHGRQIEADVGRSLAAGDDVPVTDDEHVGLLVHLRVGQQPDQQFGADAGRIAGHDGEGRARCGHE